MKNNDKDSSPRFFKPFKNKYGYFSNDGYEYIIIRPDTPRPWTNIISNGDYGLIISQAGGGFSWKTHVNLNRLTRWNQDLIRDDWGKWLYLRDLDSGEFRSLAYQPVQANYDKYEVRHGLGYTIFEQQFGDISSQWTIFPAKDDPVEIWICKIINTGKTKKRFQLASYFEWNLGAGPDINREFHKIFIETKFNSELKTILATKSLWEVPSNRGHWNTNWPFIGFHSVNSEVVGWDACKEVLIGRHGSFQNPKGIQEGTFSKTSGKFHDSVASLATNIEIEAGEKCTTVFLLGMDSNEKELKATPQITNYIKKYADEKNANQELENVKDFWRELTTRVQVQTPDDSFDILSNIWLKYQVFSGHMWARTGYYQQSGAFGYRDQIQSSQVWLPHDPSKMLDQILLNAKHQFKNGTVLHWWHPITNEGKRTNMSDDLLWLPFMLNRYFKEVGEFSVLSEKIPYYDQGEGSLQEHCIRAINTVLGRFSNRGLPLIGDGDWCDGFSAVGLDWKGESIWLGMFLYDILNSWADILENHSPKPNLAFANEYKKRAKQLKEALNFHGWNGQWYLAATKDDGTPIGDPANEECKIYLMSQTWAIISNVAEGERREKIIDAIQEHLEGDNGFLLFHPAFKNPDRYIGYITRYAPGLRENGGVYTHAATWGIMALAIEKHGEDTMRLFNKLNPILQTEKDVERYFAEPYVLPGNIDGKDSDHYGRAGWSWYTGSAGWLFTIAHESICGIQPTISGLKIDPCIPKDWDKIQIKRKFRGAIYNIKIENPNHNNFGIKQITINGKVIKGNVIPAQPEGNYEVIATIE